jgi:hypothetical protein
MDTSSPNILVKSSRTKSSRTKSSRTKSSRTKSSRTKTLKTNLSGSISELEFTNSPVSLKTKVTKKKPIEEKFTNTNEISFDQLSKSDEYTKFISNNKNILEKCYEKLGYLASFNEQEYDSYCELSSKVPLTNSQIKLMKYRK